MRPMTLLDRTTPALLLSIVLVAPLGAQSLWSRVPAFPTACYTKNETFAADVEKARSDLDAAITRQAEVNAAVKAKQQALDMGQQQARMMAFLQKDPVAGRKYMEAVAAGPEQQTRIAAMSTKRAALQEQWNTAKAEFDTERAALVAMRQKAAEQGESGGSPARARELTIKHNGAYEQHCAKWFRDPKSPFLVYLADLKRFLVEDAIPYGESAERTEPLNFQVFGIPATGYRTTATSDAVKEYLEVAGRVFDPRLAEPMPTGAGS